MEISSGLELSKDILKRKQATLIIKLINLAILNEWFILVKVPLGSGSTKHRLEDILTYIWQRTLIYNISRPPANQ